MVCLGSDFGFVLSTPTPNGLVWFQFVHPQPWIFISFVQRQPAREGAGDSDDAGCYAYWFGLVWFGFTFASPLVGFGLSQDLFSFVQRQPARER